MILSARLPRCVPRLPIACLGLALALNACGPAGQSPATPAADAGGAPVAAAPGGVRLVFNAVIHSMDRQQAQATAMAFSADGAVLQLGSDAQLLAAWPDAQPYDLAGATVLPGLIDAHGHLLGLAQSLMRADLTGARDLPETIARLVEFEQNLGPGDWLIGRGWDQNDWPGQAFPSRRDLDVHFPDRPVWLGRIDGHAGWANSAALAMLDRDLSGSWQEQGGYIHRDGEGQPTGILVDMAMRPLDALVPPLSEEQVRQGMALAISRMVSLGLTGVHDPGIDRATVALYQDLIAQGQFDTRVYAMTDGAGATLDWLCANGPLAHASGRLFMRATKLYGDGALGSRGAALLADYSDDPGNSGLLFLDAAAMQALIDRVLGCGFQAAVHAIGDRANRVVLDALEASIARHPDNPGRHRIEHAQILDGADLQRFAGLGVIAAMQPIHATSDMYWAGERLGEQRLQFAYAWRSLLDSGARVAFGSDFPVEVVNPMLGIYAAVSRQDLDGWPQGGWQAQERVLREEALRGFTLDAAYAGFMEDSVGSLTAGKRADFVVLSGDPLSVPVEEIPRIRVLQTWLDGALVYAAAVP